MMKKSSILSVVVMFFFLQNFSQETERVLPIIPKPTELILLKGNFKLSKSTQIIVKNTTAFINEADLLNAFLEKQFGFRLSVVTKPTVNHNYIEFKSADWQANANENYELNVSIDKISVLALEKCAGGFYAIQTLIQTLPIDSKQIISIPCLHIKDSPRFKWRGMHLDVCRHFFPKDFIKKYIDLLALYKMNTFHWHLTEDQAWRIEIKKYPRLTQVGAWRKGSMLGAYKDQKFDTIPYGGFYSQEDIQVHLQL